MAVVTPENFDEFIAKKLWKRRNSMVDYLAAKFVDAVCQYTPVENGHAHEAWCTAAEQAAAQLYRSRHLERAEEKHRSTKASGDLEAAKGGRGKATANKGALSVSLENKLPFVYKMEHGLPIKVGDRAGRTGHKVGGVATAGELYSPRSSSPGVSGWLFWRDASGEHFAKVRTPPATHAFARAVQVVRNAAKRYSEKQEIT